MGLLCLYMYDLLYLDAHDYTITKKNSVTL